MEADKRLYNDMCMMIGGKTSMTNNKLHCITHTEDTFVTASAFSRYIKDTEAIYQYDLKGRGVQIHTEVKSNGDKINGEITANYDVDKVVTKFPPNSKPAKINKKKILERDIKTVVQSIKKKYHLDVGAIECKVSNSGDNEISVMCEFQINRPKMVDYINFPKYARNIAENLEILFVPYD